MATEKRLIDTDALGIGKAKREAFDNPAYADGWNSAIAIIENAPTVDAMEVVHGRWEDVYGGKYQNKRYRCTACKEKALFKFRQDELLNWYEEQKLSNYCPNCGAKMDGDGNG